MLAQKGLIDVQLLRRRFGYAALRGMVPRIAASALSREGALERARVAPNLGKSTATILPMKPL